MSSLKTMISKEHTVDFHTQIEFNWMAMRVLNVKFTLTNNWNMVTFTKDKIVYWNACYNWIS